MRVLSRILFVSGALLLAFWAVARVHAIASSQVALAQMPAAPAATASEPATHQVATDDGRFVDVTLWSAKRIAEFEAALHMKADPPIAVVAIPRIGIEAPVFKGVDEITLNRGIGWIPGTPPPGANGNCGIAGHRDGFFRPLKDVVVGDTIELRTSEGGVQAYAIDKLTIVEPTAVDVLAPADTSALTLVTCYPFYFVGAAPQRFVVHAVAASVPQPSSSAAAAHKR